MKILQVIHQFLPDHIGGIELYLKNTSLRLVKAGHEVLIFSGVGDVFRNPVAIESNVDGLKIISVQKDIGSRAKRFKFFHTFNNPAAVKIFKHVIN